MNKVHISTKSETLDAVSRMIKTSTVLPQLRFTVGDWKSGSADVVSTLKNEAWFEWPIIVRSSSLAEDQENQSMAGYFASVAGVDDDAKLFEAIETVINSFHGGTDGDQVFIQPMLQNILFSGVLFTWDPNTGGPYYVVNYAYGDTADQITSGVQVEGKTFYHHHLSPIDAPDELIDVISLAREIEEICGPKPLDVEFAKTTDGTLYLLQVRHLVGENWFADINRHSQSIDRIANKVSAIKAPHPYLAGKTSMFGIMPDWNPAEIIGVRPKPFALSLYRDLITDATWAYQRGNYGYRNLRSMPLMMSFCGLPYIDVRVSFNSFVPEDVDDELADRLVNYYLDRLAKNPELHDKVEFDIVFSCYFLDFDDRVQVLQDAGFSAQDIEQLTKSLRLLTNNIINNNTGLWKQDLAKIDKLEDRLDIINKSHLDDPTKVYWLLEDCRRYGTLPFAGLARAGFIAVQLLKSLVSVGILTEEELDCFNASLSTVASNLSRDKIHLDKDTFLAKYGHLRPGTYDITSNRYDEAADFYFSWDRDHHNEEPLVKFQLTLSQMRDIEKLLTKHELDHDVMGLFEFIKAAIEGREYAKFVFTKNLSTAMSLFKNICDGFGISQEDSAFADIQYIRDIIVSSDDPKAAIERSIEIGKERFALTSALNLPPLIVDGKDVWSFWYPDSCPNYISLGKAEGHVVCIDQNNLGADLKGKIVFIESADPGYDWIFSHAIGALVTKYGGVNSHMAIRAGELNIPAVIGAGEKNFVNWSSANYLVLDCAARQVEVIS